MWDANRDDPARSPVGQGSPVRVATMARRYVQVSQLHRPDGVDGTLVAGFPGGCGLGIKRGAGTVRHLGDVNGHAPAGFRKM